MIDSFADASMASAAAVAGIIFWFTFKHLNEQEDEMMDLESKDVRHASTSTSSAPQENFSDSASLRKANTCPIKKE